MGFGVWDLGFRSSGVWGFEGLGNKGKGTRTGVVGNLCLVGLV